MSVDLNIIEAMDDPMLFQPWFPGETWSGWRTVLKAANALPMTADEVAFFRTIADRDPPEKPVKELWIIVGRRGGKDSIASVIAAHQAALFASTSLLRPGERALVMCLAVDRDQARIVLNYTRSYFTDIELLKGMVQRETASGFELDNSVDIAVSTNSFRSVRGRPILCAILDETAFWRDDNSASPDEETYRALKPALATLPGSIVVGISSPYRRSGLLYRKYKDHFGKNSPDVLVIKAPTRTLNPMIPQSVVDEAMIEDPASARAEWMAEFRDDIAAFVTEEAIDKITPTDVLERSPVRGETYFAFVDPSGGVSDSMTMAIGHRAKSPKKPNKTIAVLDAVREVRAPFSPESAVAEFAKLLKDYWITSVKGDRYAGEWPREAFQKHGISYRASDLSKSEIYVELLPRLNSEEVELLDHKRLKAQLLGLERRTARGGRDSIDHAPGAHDDIANSVAGVLVSLAERYQPTPATFGRY